MSLIAHSFKLLAVAAILAVQALPLQAQPFPSTIVRSDGGAGLTCADFANRCTTIAKGILNVSPGGTVFVLDGNVEGALLVDRPVTILSTDGRSHINADGVGTPSSGILVHTNSVNDIVTIRGINIDQRGGSRHGLSFVGRGTLRLEDCFIRGSGNGFGINFAPNGPSELHISNCTIADNGLGGSGGGVSIRPLGTGSANVILENVRMENNRSGLTVDRAGTTGAVNVTVRNSTISGNVILGALSNGSGAVLRLANTTVSANATGLAIGSSGQIISVGGNVVTGNTVNGAFSSTIAQQ